MVLSVLCGEAVGPKVLALVQECFQWRRPTPQDPADRKKRWCAACAKSHEGAVRLGLGAQPRGGTAITCPSRLNVLKDTYDNSCY